MPLRIPALLMTTLLMACAAGTDVAQSPPPGYVTDVESRIAGVNWQQATPVSVRLDEFSFQPDRMSFGQGKPYRLMLDNVGTRAHTFTSEGFFKAIAVRRVTTPQTVIQTPALVNLEVPPGETFVVEFVPVQAGTFDLKCSEPLHSSFGMTGSITIR